MIDENAKIISSEPVLVHLKGGPHEHMGHFVVWLPSSSDSEVHYWDGLAGEVVLPTADFNNARSGAILLVSAQPIDEASVGLFIDQMQSSITRWIAFVCVIIGFSIAFTAAIAKFIRRFHFPNSIISEEKIDA